MAFLGTVFMLFSLSILSESIFHAEVPEQAGYEIAAAEGGGRKRPQPSRPGLRSN